MSDLTDISGVGNARADSLREEGFESVEDVAEATPDSLSVVSGVSEETAKEFILDAESLLDDGDDDADEDESVADDEFDLTPREIEDEIDESDADDGESEADDGESEADDGESEESDDADDGAAESDESGNEDDESDDLPDGAIRLDDDGNPVYEVSIEFENRGQFDTFHAALMRYHESIYTSHQPSADLMARLIENLDNFESVTYELTEEDLNRLHTAVLDTRTSYQADNMIDHMEHLQAVQDQIDDVRNEYLF